MSDMINFGLMVMGIVIFMAGYLLTIFQRHDQDSQVISEKYYPVLQILGSTITFVSGILIITTEQIWAGYAVGFLGLAFFGITVIGIFRNLMW